MGLPHATLIAITVSSLLAVACTSRKLSTGINVTLLRRGPDPFHYTDADGLYIIAIQSKDVVRIRNEYVRIENLGTRLEEVFRTRVERLIFVKVEGQVQFADVIRVLDRASSRVQLQYGLITERSTPTPAEPSLFMHGEFIYTQYFMPLRPMPLVRRSRR
jgi:biopolymer transport protein ExbD